MSSKGKGCFALLRCLLAVVVLLTTSASSIAGGLSGTQQRRPLVLIFDTPDGDVDCPRLETAVKDAFAQSPRYEIVEIQRLLKGGAMLFTVSCVSLHDAHVLSAYYSIQNFDDNAKAKTNASFSTESTGHLLVINKSPKDFAETILVSFDQSIKKHYEQP